MKGIMEQMEEGNVYHPAKFTLKDFTDYLGSLFEVKTPTQSVIRINTGLLGSHLYNWNMEAQASKLPRYYTTTFKHKYGIVQISVGKKHSLNKVIVDMREAEGFGKYSVIVGTTEIAKAESFTSALSYFKNHQDSQLDLKLEVWKIKHSYYKRHNRRRSYGNI